jgi:mycothiol system anti-sigma-R factor
MSCGKPHEKPCDEVIEQVYLYIDGELGEDGKAIIAQHLDECSPCLREYGLEEAVKALVKRSCGQDRAPQELRARVVARIEQVRIELRRST